MVNENKDKKVILTDEELKEVAGGVSSPPGAKPVCRGLTPYNCVRKKQVCAWDKAKNECVSTKSYIVY